MNGTGIYKTALLLILALNSFGRDYYISFDYTTKNGKLSVEHFNCSNALISLDSEKKFLFKLPLYKDELSTCYKFKEKIVDNLLKQDIYVNGSDYLNGSISSKVKLVCLPKRFDIIIKGKYVYFYLKEEE